MEIELLSDLAFQSLVILVIISFLLERGLAIFFEMDWLNPPEHATSGTQTGTQAWAQRAAESINAMKVVIAVGIAWFICWYYDFDIISTILEPGVTTGVGKFITATVIAGGSQASIKLFQDIMGFSKTARAARSEIRKEITAADIAEAKARKEIAEANEKAEKAEAEARKAKADNDTAEQEAVAKTIRKPQMPDYDEILQDVTECFEDNTKEWDYDETPDDTDKGKWKMSSTAWRAVCKKIDKCLSEKNDIYDGHNAAYETRHTTYKEKYGHIPITIATKLKKMLSQ